MILRSVETEDLVLANEGADEVLRDKLSAVCLRELQPTYRMKVEVLGPVRLTEVQEAQKRIINCC